MICSWSRQKRSGATDRATWPEAGDAGRPAGRPPWPVKVELRRRERQSAATGETRMPRPWSCRAEATMLRLGDRRGSARWPERRGRGRDGIGGGEARRSRAPCRREASQEPEVEAEAEMRVAPESWPRCGVRSRSWRWWRGRPRRRGLGLFRWWESRPAEAGASRPTEAGAYPALPRLGDAGLPRRAEPWPAPES